MRHKAFFNIFLCVCFYLKNVQCAPSYIILLERMECIEGEKETLVDFSQWRIIRRGQNYFIDGNYTYHVDMDNSFSRGITTAFSPSGNSRFINHPFLIEKTPMCTFYNTTYKKYIEKSFLGHTNFPKVPPGGMCPIPKGNYFAKEAVLDEKTLPDYIPNGLWRLEEKYFQKNKCIGGLRLFAHINGKT